MSTSTPITAADRRRLWHPRGTLCAVCRQPTRGFGWFDPHRSKRRRPSVWFCSMPCQSFWTHLARERFAMVDLTEEERAAITATMKRVALLMDEIGWATPLADLTEAQVRALIEEAVEGFREAMSDIARAQTPEVPL
ncbi:DUF6511 domain-containing protein [Paracoccus yeei]|uniref:DUF6511 domain-containing protein n=2 Tax=Paracoccus yeei TaxID=147645 RepID=UPI003BF7EE58